MCGISGIINKSNSPIPKEQIKNMNDLIKHRGPDDEGFYFEKNFAFGHRRLAILDLSKDGHQPMEYLEKYVITYNGEIYNYLEIRDELIKDGYKFKSNTDTEVMLASYDKWGENCVNKFNGMWAFALYDKEKNIIFCSRDRFGIKPFYYTQIDDKFIFGSEIKQLLEFYDERFVNKEILVDYIVTGIQEYSNETFFKNIFKLEQSCNMIYCLSSHQYNIEKYYEINFYPNKNNIDQDIKNYTKKLNCAIDLRLRSDVLIGTCLSGGLDSSSVATLSSRKYNTKTEERFIAIHAKSSEKQTDESDFAILVANEANLDLKIIEPTSEEFKKNIDEVVYTQEEPFGSPSIFMQYFVMKKAKEVGCKVMLDGQGGDETLLGYEKYYPSAYLDVFRNYGFIRMLKEVLNSNKNNSKMSLVWIVKYTIGSLFSSLRKKEYKKRTSFLKPFNNNFSFLDDLAKKYKNIKNLQEMELMHTNLPILLRYEDKNSMRHSVEARLPFIDFETLEYALNINITYKIKDGWTKYILRKIINNKLSKTIVWRKNKLGFNAPENIWLKEINLKMIKEIKASNIMKEISHVDKLVNKFGTLDARLKWRLYNVAVWERVYNVKI